MSPHSADNQVMQNRLSQLLLAELLAFSALFSGGLASLGAVMTSSGDSRHPVIISWLLVASCASLSVYLTRLALVRLRRLFARAS